jgi:hypothetical protein
MSICVCDAPPNHRTCNCPPFLLIPIATQMLALNCNLSKMSIIDINGVLSFFDLTAKAPPQTSTGALVGSNAQGEHLQVR